jgi:hypothetical protein
VQFLQECYRHAKPIGATNEGNAFLDMALPMIRAYA